MNRIIIIGNGFDLAHGLKTGYKDFIDFYLKHLYNQVDAQFSQIQNHNFRKDESLLLYDDELVNITARPKERGFQKGVTNSKIDTSFATLCCKYDTKCIRLGSYAFDLNFNNQFLRYIINCSLTNWVDIENEYYCELKKLLLEEDLKKRSESVCNLNKEFEAVKNLLEEYLGKITDNTKIEKQQSIQDAFSSFIEIDEIATYKQTEFVNSIFSDMCRFDDTMDFEQDKQTDPQYNILNSGDETILYFIKKKIERESFKKNYCIPHTLILNFNYTKIAEKLYSEDEDYEFINIHGELKSIENPIIFGYGDELDDDYKRIEKLQNNDFLENIKSIKYHKTANYRNLLKFIALGPYQAFVMGHSCGNSDRTLLNTLFEHTNCISIKVFYHQFKKGSDSNEKCSDNYIDLIKNISRNFNNKPNMRDIVVSWEKCSPLVFA